MSLRMDKVNKEMMRQVAQIIRQEIDDPVVEFLSITRVDTSADLSLSKVYFSLLDENNYLHAEEVFKKMGKFIRMRLGQRMRIKILPQLKFIPDDAIKYSLDIHKKIEEIKAAEGLKDKNKKRVSNK